ncbi:MAG TPA: hypothetical protein VJK53_02840 [Candidatus Paceibacterota bacterium]
MADQDIGPVAKGLIALPFVLIFGWWFLYGQDAADKAVEAWRVEDARQVELALAHIRQCAQKNAARHLSPFQAYAGPTATLYTNSVVSTGNTGFRLGVNALWEEAKARGWCVVYKRTGYYVYAYIDENPVAGGYEMKLAPPR